MNTPKSEPPRRAKPAGLMKRLRSRVFRREAYHLLDHGTNRWAGLLMQRVIMALILVSVFVAVLESVPSLEARWGRLFNLVERVAVAVFIVEYAARLWVCVEHPPYRDLAPWRARLTHVRTADAIVDFIAILPFFAEMLGLIDVRALLLLRLLRFLKLTRYSPGMRSLVDAVRSEKVALLSCLLFLVSLALMSAAVMHWAEQEAQPDKFGTVPDALYWALITLTTVGYGDVTPVTPLGKIIASITALLGLMMLALPVGILATSFAQSIQRRDFVVTWSMVARVPVFNQLKAEEIADIMRYLHSQIAEAGEVIVRRGDLAQSMYFIAAGEVVVELSHKKVPLGEGHFFGEVALIQQAKRIATVRALSRTKLLVLDAADLRGLMERRPDIAAAIAAIAGERMQAHAPMSGDIAPEELAENTARESRD